jgi:hypothetical protein
LEIIMKAIQNRREFMAQHWYPFMGFLLVGLVWAGIANILLYRSLNVTTSWTTGAQMSIWAEWSIQVGLAAPLLLICYLILGIGIYNLMWGPRWWLSMASLWIIGTPVSISIGRLIAVHLWSQNRGGLQWEAMVPPTIGFIVAFLAAMLMEWIVSYFHKDKDMGSERQ